MTYPKASAHCPPTQESLPPDEPYPLSASSPREQHDQQMPVPFFCRLMRAFKCQRIWRLFTTLKPRRGKQFEFSYRITLLITVVMVCVLLRFAIWAALGVVTLGELPTLYEHYTNGGLNSGLEALPSTFSLNGRDIKILSGAVHYFRVHPAYWRDRLRKLRACGLNTVETYVPWNLHNPTPDTFDFGSGGTDMSDFLDVRRFIQLAQEEDLLVIMRPGPYICAEWEFGGLPSWLLRDPQMRVRTSYTGYTDYVAAYYNQLIPLFKDLQFVNGGPIIAFQLENEYGSFGTIDKNYLAFLKTLLERNGIQGLFFTSDSPLNSGNKGSLPGVLQTANFQDNADGQLNALKNLQPDKPFMVMEYWTGWFDHWTELHHTTTVNKYETVLEQILSYPASVNLYMFHGGTNWGFLNGANVQSLFPTYQPDVTSYDYDAPLSEAGDYTAKYNATKKLMAKYNPVATRLPEPPAETKKVAYPYTPIIGQMLLDDIILNTDLEDRVEVQHVLPMEQLPVNSNAGQSYGLILYRKARVAVQPGSVLQVKGRIRDVGLVMLDGIRQTEALVSKEQFDDFGYWEKTDATLTLNSAVTAYQTLDILVENWGRNNFGHIENFQQYKGLVSGPVILDGVQLENWEITALQFKKKWLNSLKGWQPISRGTIAGPTLFRSTLMVSDPQDTFLDMSSWGKGIVFVNGFTLGRYLHLGPPNTLFLPAPLLQEGENEILVFELFSADSKLVFRSTPILG